MAQGDSKNLKDTAGREDASGQLLQRVRPHLAQIAQLLSLAGIAGLLAAIGLNSLIFSLWGLTFLQLATPSDVLLSGLQLAFLIVFPMLAAVLGWWIGTKITAISGSYVRIAVIIFLGLLIILHFVTVLYFKYRLSVTISFAIFSFLYSALIRSVERVRTLRRGSSRRRPKKEALNVTWLGLGIIMCYQIAEKQITRIYHNGMSGGLLHRPAPENCLRPLVLWVGERAVVVRCPTNEIRVLYNAENIEVREGPSNIAAP